MHTREFSTEVGGKKLTAQFTDLAEQAHGSVLLRYGNTVILATAVMSGHEKEGMDYFPLSVDYEEKFYAAGAILGSRFVRREGRPTDEAILSGRVVDRAIRPLFDQRIRNEVQVVITVLSIDEDDPDVLAVTAASLALSTSDIPWGGPVSAVRVGKMNGSVVINPTYSERANLETEYDLFACGKDGDINMIEIGAQESGEDTLIEALSEASRAIETLQDFQNNIIQEMGKEKRIIKLDDYSPELRKFFTEEISPKLEGALFSGTGKQRIHELKDEWKNLYAEQFPEEKFVQAEDYFEEKVNELLHQKAIDEERRPDGRAMDELRPLFAQAGGVSEVIHGTGIFYRGGTHVFSALTLGGPDDSQLIDNMEERDAHKRFMHHYNFPPFSTGEIGRMGGVNRRMVGHGALAEKALRPIIPPQKEFPYTIRVVSEALASNGSTSMASVCASSLALMDGGVPIRKPAAGIAMGLMQDKEGKYKILTDIQGPEDEHGDMDFKVAGTRDGITAVQMDVKVNGVSIPVLKEAFERAKKARLEILDVITREIPKPRESLSPRAPHIVMMGIKEEQIGQVIGPGGKTINDIKDRTGVEEITIEQDGTVYITGKGDSALHAKKIVEEMTHEYKVGEKFTGVVSRILDFGAFVRIGAHTEGLVHISELAPFRVEKVGDVLKEGEEVPVIIKEIDAQNRINLSIKRIAPDFAKQKGLS